MLCVNNIILSPQPTTVLIRIAGTLKTKLGFLKKNNSNNNYNHLDLEPCTLLYH